MKTICNNNHGIVVVQVQQNVCQLMLAGCCCCCYLCCMLQAIGIVISICICAHINKKQMCRRFQVPFHFIFWKKRYFVPFFIFCFMTHILCFKEFVVIGCFMLFVFYLWLCNRKFLLLNFRFCQVHFDSKIFYFTIY